MDYAELMLIVKPALHEKLLCKRKMNQMTSLFRILAMHLERNKPNVHLNTFANEARLCIWLCEATYLFVWGMDLEGLAIARLFQLS